MTYLHHPSPKQRKRSPLLIAAYCTFGGAVMALGLGAGMFWVLGFTAIAVLLALGEVFVQLIRR